MNTSSRIINILHQEDVTYLLLLLRAFYRACLNLLRHAAYLLKPLNLHKFNRTTASKSSPPQSEFFQCGLRRPLLCRHNVSRLLYPNGPFPLTPDFRRCAKASDPSGTAFAHRRKTGGIRLLVSPSRTCTRREMEDLIVSKRYHPFPCRQVQPCPGAGSRCILHVGSSMYAFPAKPRNCD